MDIRTFEIFPGVAVHENFVPNVSDIVQYLFDNEQSLNFIARTGKYKVKTVGVESKVSSLLKDDIPAELKEMIFAGLPERHRLFHHDIQIQRYTRGGSITIHKEASSYSELHLFNLYSDPEAGDGLTVYDRDSDQWHFIEDRPGNFIEFGTDIYHCIKEIKSDLRYSMVVGF